MRTSRIVVLMVVLGASFIFSGVQGIDAKKITKKPINIRENKKVLKIKRLPLHMKKLGSQKYRVTITFTLQNPSMNLTKLVVAVPFPDTTVSHYQQVSNVSMPAGWRKVNTSNGEYYARFEASGSALPEKGKTKSYSYSFDITLYGLVADGDQNQKVTSTVNSANRQYFGNDYPYIDRNNSDVRTISNRLWGQSAGNILVYAKKAYEYVASQYRYQQAYTGLHPLAAIIRDNGGDCGNLSSLFISLMQAKNIPARHLVAVSPRQNYHAWAEFYTNQGGWIPVDVTYKNAHPSGDYFAVYRLNTAHIVMHKRLNMQVVDINGGTFTTPILQTFLYWVHGSGDINRLRPSYTVSAQAR